MRSGIVGAVVLAALFATAVAVPVATVAKQASAQKPRTIQGVAVDSTGLPTWLATSIGKRTSDGEAGDFTFPPTLDSVAKLQQDKGWVGFRMLTAPRNVVREERARGVVYRARQYDVVQHVLDDDRMRESIVVRSRQGVKTWRWQLSRSGPGAAPRLTAKGQIVWGDGAYIDRPAIHDFDSTKTRDLDWSLRGNVLSLTVDDRRLPVPYVIDPPVGADTTPPVVTFDGFVENTPLSTHVNAAGNTLYYRPGTPGNFGMRFRATDAQSLIDYTTFPNLGAGWSPGGNDTSGFSGSSAAPASGTGLNGSYANYPAAMTPCAGVGSPANAAFDGVGFSRTDGPIDFDWGNFAPAGATGINADCFTVRWMGYFEAPVAGDYRFRTRSDDGARLWVDGYLSNNLWTEHATTNRCGGQVDNASTPGITLTAGQRVPIVADFNENGGQAVFGLQYRTTAYTAANCTAAWNMGGWTTIPATRLYQAERYEWTYSWAANPAAPPAGLGVTARDAAGNVSNPKNFSVIPDGAGPTGVSLTHATGLQTGTSATLTFDKGSDAATQAVPTWVIQSRTRPLLNDACTTGAWSAWSTIATNAPLNPTPAGTTAGSYTATGLTGGQCHEFQIVAEDGVGNPTIATGPGAVRVDNAGPTGIGPVNDGPVSGTDQDYFTMAPIDATWSLATDTWSGVNDLEWCLGTGVNAAGCTSPIVAFTNVPGGTTTTSASRMGVALVAGTTYFACVRAMDNAGNPWTVVCSDGSRFDDSPPAAPASVNDGSAADVDLQSSTTTAQANWPATIDPHSGTAGYQTCVTIDAAGLDCAAGALAPWSVTTAGLSGSRTGLALATGQTYYVCVRAENNAGLIGALSCSDGFQIDNLGPAAPAFVNDRNIVAGDSDFTAITTSRQADWAATTDPSGILNYEHCLSTSVSGMDCIAGAIRSWASTGLATTETVGALALANGATYYSCARAIDQFGNIGATACSDGIRVDTTPPTLPTTVNDGTGADLTWLLSTTTASANWTGGTDGPLGSGIANWEYCISTGSGCTGTVARTWTPTGTGTTQTSAALALVQGEVYFTAIRGTDNVGNAISSVSSNGQRVDSIAPPAPATINDGTGADVTYSSSGATFDANWSTVVDPAPGVGVASGLQRYQYCITQTLAGADCAGAATRAWTNAAPLTATTISATGLALVNGQSYRICIRAHDVAANAGASSCSNGTTIDTGGPVWNTSTSRDGAVSPADVAWTTSTSTLASNWGAATDSGVIDRYEYCLSTQPTGSDCTGAATKPWTTNNTTLTQTSTGLTLAEALTYYSCIRAFDGAGNVSTNLCSNGQTVDSLAPTLPTTVQDGLGADLTWLQSLTTASANWPGGGDGSGSGIDRWEYCIATGVACSGTVAKTWTTSGTATTHTSAALPLVQGERYHTSVRGFDIAGNATPGSVSSDGQRVDTVAPPAPATVNDGAGADLDFSASASVFPASWSAVVDPAPGVGVASGLWRYQYCITTDATGTNCAGAATVTWTNAAPLTATSMSHTGLALTNGTTYYSCIRAHDVATNTGALACSDGTTIDTGGPVWGTSTSRDGSVSPTDINWTTSATTLAGNWGAATDPGGIDRYEYCLSTLTNCGGTIARTWTANGITLSQSSGGLTLTNGATYFSCIRAFDVAGNVSTELCSNGQRVDNVPPTLPTTVQDGLGADLTWLQSPTTASANWPGGSDVLSGIDRWEYCISTGTACSGTVVKTWTTAGTAATQTSAALSLVQGERYHTSVRGFDVAGNATPGSVSSDGQRVDTIAPPAPATVNDGLGADVSFISSSTTMSANWSAVVDPAPGVGVASGLQRYQYCITTDPVATAAASCAGAATVAWTDNAPLTATSMTRSGLSLTNGSSYRVCIRTFDGATNVGPLACSNAVVVDLGPPTASWTSWTENSPNLFSPPGSNVLWFNPSAPVSGSGAATATVTATDPGAGMSYVAFPSLGALGWGPGGNDSTVGAADTWTWNYSFTGGGTINDPAINNATAYDNGGAFTVSPTLDFDIRADSVAPTGGSMPLLSGLQTTTLLNQSIPLGTDAGSGLSHWVVDEQFAPMADGVCGSWDPWLLGDGRAGSYDGSPGTASNGQVLSHSTYLNDTNLDGTPEFYDSFCFRIQVRTYDRVGNMTLIPANGLKRFDFADPVAAISGPAAGSSQSGTFTIAGTATDQWAGVAPEYPNTGSGMQRVEVTYELPDGPDADTLVDAAGNACPPSITSFAGPWSAHTWACSWNTGALPDGLYTVRVQGRDNAGRTSTIATTTYLVDNQAPVLAWHSWNDYGNPSLHAVGNVAWVNPNAAAGAYQLDARLTATDAGSGVNRVEFPTPGANWTPAGTSNATFTSPVPVANAFTRAFTFANPGTVTVTGSQLATAFDNAGVPNAASVGYELRLDAAAPLGVTAGVANTRQATPSVVVTLGGGSESALGSGIAGWTLRYDTAPLVDDACGSFTNTWTAITTGVGVAPATSAHDVTALGSQCYRYQLEVRDNVGNAATSASATAQRVDLVAPTVLITAPANGSVQGSAATITGTAGDTHTGVGRVRVTWTGPEAPGTGVICDPATLGGTSPTWTFTCGWNTATPIAFDDGSYIVTATSYDRAGNPSATHSISVILDNFPPFIGFHSFTETSPYTHWAGPVGTNTQLWYNPLAPAGSYSFGVLVTASDPNGISGVDYAGAGAGWTPSAGIATQTVASGPATRYTQTYSFDTSGAVADPPTLGVVARDAANNPAGTTFELTPDTAQPAPGSISYPNGFHGSTSVVVTFATGADTLSGVRGWELLRSTGTLSGATCVGWSAYATSGATGTGSFSGTRTDTVGDPGCYRYRLVTTDNVGNQRQSDGASETKVDLVPPTGTLVLAEATGAAAQYLATPTRLFVNTGVGNSGTFTATVNATAASGILDAQFPALAAGFTGNSTQPGPGPVLATTYAWTGPAGSPGAGLQAGVRSNSLGSLNLPFEVIADTTGPSGGTIAHAGGFSTSTTTTVNYTVGNDAAGSGLASYRLERESGTLAAGACTWSGTWNPAGPANGPLSYTDATLVHATCYRYRVAMTDNVGNAGSSTMSPAAIMVDTTAPTSATMVFDYVAPTGYFVAPAALDLAWYDQSRAMLGASDWLRMTVNVVDLESGTGAVAFPTLPAGWNVQASGSTATSAWQRFTHAAAAAEPGVVTATATNGAGIAIPVTGSILADDEISAIANWQIDYIHGYDTDNSITVTWAEDRTDDKSGFQNVSLLRRAYPYNVGTGLCDSAPFVDTNLGVQAGTTYVDNSLVDGFCYRYWLRVTDRVGNVNDEHPVTGGATPPAFASSWPTWDWKTVVEVDDIFPPQPFNLTLPANPVLPAITSGPTTALTCETAPTYASSTPALSWTASADFESGLSHYNVYVDGTGAIDATIPAPTTTWSPLALVDGAHTLGVRAVDNNANFTNAGPAFPTNVRIDTTAPTGSLSAPAHGSWTGDSTPLLDWTATDTNCLARIEVHVDGAAVPDAVVRGDVGSWTPTAPLANGMHSWRFVAIDSLGTSTSVGPFTFGVDTVNPAAFAVTAPTAGQTVRGFVNVAWTASMDLDSGLAPAAAYQVLVDGSVRATLASGTTSTSVPGITNGTHTVIVRALDAVGNSTDTASVTFTGYGVIPAPVLTAPANASFHNSVPLLDWDWPGDGGPAPTSYNIYLNGVNVGSETYPTTQHTLAADPGNGTHTWRVEQLDPYTGSVTSTSRTFTIDRTAPVNPGPLTRSVTTVSWTLPTDPSAPVASGIDYLQFHVIGVGGSIVTMSASSTSRNYGMLPDGVYNMFVRAFDRAGNATDSPSISVINDSAPPSAFNLDPPAPLTPLPAINAGPIAPTTCESAPTYVSATPTLSWQTSIDATSGLNAYDVYVDSVLVASVPAPTTTHTLTAPLTGGAHTWRVEAKDNFGLVRTSTPSPMNVRVDGASPNLAFGAPANSAFTSDTTPSFSWSAGDDNCIARVELTVGSNVYVLVGSAGSFTPAAVLPEGATTWSLRAFDSAGQVVSAGAARTINIDTTPPSGITATFPANASTVPEGMLTFDWSNGSDVGGSGVARYDLIIDGSTVATNLVPSSNGTHQILGGASAGMTQSHTWSVRVFDAVGNSAVFPFSFLASFVADTTAPSPFDLLTPANAAVIPAGTALTWAPSWDFKGVTQYRIYIDGTLAGTTAGNVTSFTPSAGAGAPICTVDFDPSVSAGCLAGPTYNYGSGGTTGGALTTFTGGTWNTTTAAGWSASGNALGIGDQSLPTTDINSGFDGDRKWRAVDYQTTIPAAGADIRLEHRYNMHMVASNAYDGGTIELMIDKDGGGFGNDVWEQTCEKGATAIYGSSIRCTYQIIDHAGAPNVVMGGSSVTNHPIYKQNAFSGSSGGMVQTKLSMANFAGKNVIVRFKLGTDSCYSSLPVGAQRTACSDPTTGAPGFFPAQWRIDNVELAHPALLPGLHSWRVEARDAAGNSRFSNQTWSFNLL